MQIFRLDQEPQGLGMTERQKIHGEVVGQVYFLKRFMRKSCRRPAI